MMTMIDEDEDGNYNDLCYY